MRKVLFTFLFLFQLCAFAMPPEPARCPEAEAIKLAGLESVIKQKDKQDHYMALKMDQFGTEDMWVFALIDIPAKSYYEAMSTAQLWLSTLEGQPKPAAYEPANVWICVYKTAEGHVGATFAPANSDEGLRAALRRLK